LTFRRARANLAGMTPGRFARSSTSSLLCLLAGGVLGIAACSDAGAEPAPSGTQPDAAAPGDADAGASTDADAVPSAEADTASPTDADAASPADADAWVPTCPLEQCVFPPLAPWRVPIQDFLDQAKKENTLDYAALRKQVGDLIVFEDHLYFGYGDADINVGRLIPIQIRHYASPDDALPVVELPKTDEEEIALYRRFGDTLYIPGVDATEDAFIGNAFTRPKAGVWTKRRSIQAGVHVHDIAEFKGALYACGSGTLNIDDWNTGKVHSWLWRSTDGGASWTAAADVANTEVGDRRFTLLVPFPDQLLVFGYRANSQGSIVELLSNAWDGTALSNAAVAPKRFVLGGELLDGSRALVYGVNVQSPLRYEALSLAAGQAGQSIAALAGKAVLDAASAGAGQLVVLAADGDAYPAPTQPPAVRVLLTSDLATFKELVVASPSVWPTAIAVWRGGIYVGYADGSVWRSVP
jgi:hypothetical protein